MKDLAKRLVHVVDGDSFIREPLCLLIESLGYETLSFSNGQKYTDFVNSDAYGEPLATFVDVELPKVNGYEMIAEIQSIKSDLKFVVVGGELVIQDGDKPLACLYLSKPLNPDCVTEALNKIAACKTYGPSLKVGCKTPVDIGFYNITDWSCPTKTCSAPKTSH